MDEGIEKLFKSVHFKLWSYISNKNALDPEELVTAEMVVAHTVEDHSDMLRNVVLYPAWANGDVVGMDADMIHNGKKFPIRFITQNPKKRDRKDKRYLSEYAKLVQQGHTITWVLFRKSGQTQFVGRIQNGVYYKNEPQKEVRQTPAAGAPKSEGPMAEYVNLLSRELPSVPQEHIVGIVQMAGRLGMLK